VSFSERVISTAPEQVGASPVDECIKQNPPAEDTSAPKREEGYLRVLQSASSETSANIVENASTNAATDLVTQPMAEEGSGSTEDSAPPLPAVPEPNEPVEASSNPAQDKERPPNPADSTAEAANQAEELTSEAQHALDA
jgi:hypothetical protein